MNQRELFFISLTIFFTIVAWMLLEIFKAESIVKIEKEEQMVLEKPITLDREILKILRVKETP